MAIGVGDEFEVAILAASHAVGEDERVDYLALERGCETVPYLGDAGFELIGIHAAAPRLRRLDEVSAPVINFR
jgi:hypothetical protein